MAGKTVNPTRMELTRLKGRLKTARRGHKLLKDKRDELMKQFMDVVRRNRALRAKVEQGLKEANAAFTVAAALMGPEVLEEALSCPRRSVSLEVSTRNIMSVNVPVFTFQTDSGDDALLPYGFAQTSGELDAALEKMQAVFADMLELAQVEKTCAMLADEVLDPTHPARIGRIEGLAMLLLYVLSVWTAARAARREQPAEDTPAARPIAGWLMALMIVGGLAALVFGGEIFLHNAVAIARKLGVSESVIAITLVAGGTSLPELASSVVSVVKGRPDIALGNVVGSNIANILLILGLCSTVVPLTPGGIDAVTLGAVVLSSLLLFAAAFTFRRRALDRWEGVLFLAIYSAYLWWLLAK